MLLIMPYFNSKGRLKRVSDDLLLFFALFWAVRLAEAEEGMRL